jgi:hypothetical protein
MYSILQRSGASAGGRARLVELTTIELDSGDTEQHVESGNRRRRQLKRRRVWWKERDPTTEFRNLEWREGTGATRGPVPLGGSGDVQETCANRSLRRRHVRAQ